MNPLFKKLILELEKIDNQFFEINVCVINKNKLEPEIEVLVRLKRK